MTDVDSFPPAHRTWSASVDRAMRRLFILLSAVNLVAAALNWPDPDNVTATLANCGIVAVVVGAVIVVIVRGEGTATAAGSSALVVLFLLLTATSGSRSTGWALGLLTIVYVFVLVSAPRGLRWVLVAVVQLTYMAGRVPTAADRQQIAPLAVEAGSLVGVLATVILMYDGLRGFATRADQVESHEAEAQRRSLLAAVRGSQEREAERILHDHIVHALRAIATERELVSAEVARRECADALRAVDTLASRDDDATNLFGRLRQLADHSAVPVELTSDSTIADLPLDVSDALVAAAGEALRNVSRHTTSARARVEIRESADTETVTLSVIDDGGGLSNGGIRIGARGIRASIEERMREVGGQTQIQSLAGHGTSVTLSWTREAAKHTQHAAQQTIDGARTLFAWVFSPNLLACLWIAALVSPQLHIPAAGLVAGVLPLAVAAIFRTRLHAGMSMSVASAFTAATVVCVFLNAIALPMNSPDGFLFFTAGGASPLICAVIFLRPYRDGVVASTLGLAAVVGTVVHTATSAATIRALVPCVMAAVIGYGGSFILRVTIDRMSVKLLAAARRSEAAAAYQVQLDVRRAVLDQRIGRLRGGTTDLLRAVASGDLSPASSGVQRRAQLLEEAVRDDLMLGGRADDRLHNLIYTLRASGWEVRLLATETSETKVLEEARSLLADVDDAIATCRPQPANDLGAGTPSGDLVLAAVPGAGWGEVSVVMTPSEHMSNADLANALRETGLIVDVDSESLRIRRFESMAEIVEDRPKPPVAS